MYESMLEKLTGKIPEDAPDPNDDPIETPETPDSTPEPSVPPDAPVPPVETPKPVEPAPTEPVGEDPQKTIAELRRQLNEYATVKREEPVKETPATETKAEKKRRIKDAAHMDEIFSDPEKLEAWLDERDSEREQNLIQTMRTELSESVRGTVAQNIYLERKREEFKTGYPDIAPFENLNATVLNQVFAEKQYSLNDADIAAAYKETALRVRATLGLPPGGIQRTAPAPAQAAPAFAPGTGGRRASGPVLTDKQKKFASLVEPVR